MAMPARLGSAVDAVSFSHGKQLDDGAPQGQLPRGGVPAPAPARLGGILAAGGPLYADAVQSLCEAVSLLGLPVAPPMHHAAHKFAYAVSIDCDIALHLSGATAPKTKNWHEHQLKRCQQCIPLGQSGTAFDTLL